MNLDSEALLEMLRDPNRETQEIAVASGAPREDVARAARLVLGIGKAKPEEVLTLPAPLALAVLRAAAAARRGDLLAVATGHPNRDVVKEGKRALYLLKARGVAVPELRPAVPPPAPAAPEPPSQCFASAVDGHGERAIWISRPVPGKGIEVGQAVISDQKGLMELHLGLLGRKEYRTFGKDLLARGRAMGVAEIDRQHAKGLVTAARKLNEVAGTTAPEGADAWLSRLGPSTPPLDLAARFAPLPEDEEAAALEASAQLHDLPLLHGWLADEDALRALALKLDEIAVSSLYLDERQRAEAGTRAIAEAAEAHFDGSHRALWASRLFAVADHLERAGDASRARLAAASARALLGGLQAAHIPFARLLFEKAFPPPRPTAPASTAGSGDTLILPPFR